MMGWLIGGGVLCIDLGENTSPLERRQHAGFRAYFDFLWKELAVHVE